MTFLRSIRILERRLQRPQVCGKSQWIRGHGAHRGIRFSAVAQRESRGVSEGRRQESEARRPDPNCTIAEIGYGPLSRRCSRLTGVQPPSEREMEKPNLYHPPTMGLAFFIHGLCSGMKRAQSPRWDRPCQRQSTPKQPPSRNTSKLIVTYKGHEGILYALIPTCVVCPRSSFT
jgi:hypothetical protein